jgi:putative membrane protein
MIGKQTLAALAALIALAGTSAATAADQTSEKFIKEAIQGNLAEQQMGQMAQEKGSSQAVKDFGATLMADHEKANQNAIQAAQQLNVTPPDKPGLKEMANHKKLSMYSGDHFDREFVEAMVKDHKEDIARYQQQAQQGGPAGDYAKQTLPKLREHLKIAQDLERTEVAGGSHGTKER